MPKSKAKQTTQATQANGAGISKMEAVRRALAELGKDAKPLQMKEYILSRLGIDMSADHVSTYKSSLLRAGVAKKKLSTKPTAAPKTTNQANISLEDVRAVKELAERIGADKVRQLAEVLA